jgi:nitrite reductase (NADH) small subunit/3-phenylpropionate/trans-cinnamate dioxygenase ferredoxin subunit
MRQKIGKVSDIPQDGGIVVEISGRQVAVFKAGDKFYAIDNICHHQGGPLGEGYLDGTTVTCPWHAWTYDVATGECQSVPGVKQQCYQVKVEGDDVFVEA